MVKLAVLDTAERAPIERLHRGDFSASLVAFLDIVFCYGGQVIRSPPFYEGRVARQTHG
jgi:hypothetical protein